MALGDARFWLGSYTSDHGGATGSGISLLGQGENGSLHTLGSTDQPSPSWVTTHPTADVIYAALEERGQVQAYRVVGHGVRPIGEPVDAGASVCHVAVSADGSVLIAACWGDGRIVTLPLRADGGFAGQPQLAEPSSDPYAAPTFDVAAPLETDADPAFRDALEDAAGTRQSRAHTSLELPDGRILTTDLGHDTVRFWRRSGARLQHLGQVALPFGVGPRHLAMHPSGHVHVLTEYSNEIFTLGQVRDGTWGILSSIVATADSIESGDSAAEISRTRSGEHLHVGIRGSDRISTIEVRGDGSELRAIADVESGGAKPRHHLEDGGLLHVANQASGAVTTFRLDERAIPRTVVGVLETGAPTCIALA